MMLISNVPKEPMILLERCFPYYIGDRVRVQLYPTKEKEYPYSGCGIIGKIREIYHDSFVIENSLDVKVIKFDEVFIMKHVSEEENFENTPYINDEEREFWRTHWHTKEGIKEKTAEDLKMLEEFEKKCNK